MARTLLLLLASLAALSATAQEQHDSTAVPRRRNLVGRVLGYFADANKEKKNKRFDFSVIGGPHYSTDTKLGLGLVASGLYRTCQADSLLPPSNVSIFSDISTVGFYMIGLRGTHIFPHDRQRIDYTLFFYSFPSYYWGIGYNRGNDDSNKSKMNRWQTQMRASWLFRASGNLYAGPTIAVDYITAHHVHRPELLEGQRKSTFNAGAGATVLYDTRDNLTAPKRGVYLWLQQLFRPRFAGNHYAFTTTDMRTCGYLPLWKGGTLALDMRMQFNYGNPSWGMLAQLGGSNAMRGYYEGRYRDKHKVETQVELRQHVWRRSGITVWAGAGTVFDKFSSIEMRHVLPNCGVGYRWEFKKNVNVRLDYGIGKKGQCGFIFNINEAF